MTVNAVSLSGMECKRRSIPLGVLPGRARSQVLWSDTGRIIAKMVNLHAMRDRANEVLIRPSMHQNVMPAGVLHSEQTITGDSVSATPDPTRRGLMNLSKKALLDRDANHQVRSTAITNAVIVKLAIGLPIVRTLTGGHRAQSIHRHIIESMDGMLNAWMVQQLQQLVTTEVEG